MPAKSKLLGSFVTAIAAAAFGAFAFAQSVEEAELPETLLTPAEALDVLAGHAGDADPEASFYGGEDISSFFGRNGPLSDRQQAMAETAWSYFEEYYQPETGLVNAVGNYPSTTMWDTGSYISGLVAAYELGIIDKREFDRRAYQLLGTLRNLELFSRHCAQ